MQLFGGVIFGSKVPRESKIVTPLICWGFSLNDAKVEGGIFNLARFKLCYEENKAFNISVPENNPCFIEASKIRRGDMVQISGQQIVWDEKDKASGTMVKRHEVYANIVVRVIVFTAPEVHLGEYTVAPDSIYPENDREKRFRGDNQTTGPVKRKKRQEPGPDGERRVIPAWQDN